MTKPAWSRLMRRPEEQVMNVQTRYKSQTLCNSINRRNVTIPYSYAVDLKTCSRFDPHKSPSDSPMGYVRRENRSATI